MKSKTMLMRMAFFAIMLPLVMYADSVNEQCDTIIAQQAKVLTQATTQVIHAMNKTTRIKTEAKKAIDNARKYFIEGKKTLEEFTEIMRKRNATTAQAEQDLEKTIEKTIKQVEASERSYNSFISGVKKLETLALPSSKNGNTRDAKEMARRRIKGLIDQKDAITLDFEQAQKEAGTVEQRDELKKRYHAIIQHIDADICKLQFITGEIISTKRELFWDAIEQAKILIDTTILENHPKLEVQREEEETRLFTEDLAKLARDAEERSRLISQKMVAEQDLDELQIQQEELKRQFDAKAIERKKLEIERKAAEQELDMLRIQQEELQRQANAKAAEKARLETEEKVRVATKRKETKRILDTLHIQRRELQQQTTTKTAQHIKLGSQQELAGQELSMLLVQQEGLQKQVNTKIDEHTQLETEEMQLEEKQKKVEKKLNELYIQQQELKRQADAHAAEQTRLKTVKKTTGAELDVLQTQQEELQKKIAAKATEQEQLQGERAAVTAELDTLQVQQEEIQNQADAKMAEKVRLEAEAEEMGISQEEHIHSRLSKIFKKWGLLREYCEKNSNSNSIFYRNYISNK